jgi:hypothetical protein
LTVHGPRLRATMAAFSWPRGVAGLLAGFTSGQRSRRECPPRFPVGNRSDLLSLLGLVRQVGFVGSWSAFAGYTSSLFVATFRGMSGAWLSAADLRQLNQSCCDGGRWMLFGFTGLPPSNFIWEIIIGWSLDIAVGNQDARTGVIDMYTAVCPTPPPKADFGGWLGSLNFYRQFSFGSSAGLLVRFSRRKLG